jgi:hypothetical protein
VVQFEAKKKLTGMDRDCQDEEEAIVLFFILSILYIPV